MSTALRCPRCSARRIEGEATCAQCGWRFEHVTKSANRAPPPRDPTTSSSPPAIRGQVVTPWAPPPQSVWIEPYDRRTVAKASLAAFQVRCLGTIGGMIGFVVGVLFVPLLLVALTHNAFVGLLGVPIGAVIGIALGIGLTLKILSS